MVFLNLSYYDILTILKFYQDFFGARIEELIQSSEAIDENDLFFNIVGDKQKSTIYWVPS